jgi:PAS domain S-box-containing protein
MTSMRGRSRHSKAADEFAARVERFSAALAERRRIVQGFEGAAPADTDVLATVLRELREHHDALVAADEELRTQVDELRGAVARAEEERRRQQEMFQSVDVGLVVLTNKGVVEEANQVALEWLGVELRILRGTPLSTRILGPFHRRLLDALGDVRQGERVTAAMAIVRRDGTQIPIVATFSSLEDGERILVSAHRLSPATAGGALGPTEAELRVAELERALRDKDDVLARERTERERLARHGRAMERYVAALSHDLRGPIHAVLGWADLLARETLPKAAKDRAARTIARQAHLQLGLLDELLDLSRLASDRLPLHLRRVDIAALVAEVGQRFLTQGDAAGVALGFDVALAEPALVFADVRWLDQVVSNLLRNALAATPPGGHVRTAVSAEADDVVLRVTDDGRGVDPARLPFLFDLPSPAEGADESLGAPNVGLYMTKRLVEVHSGTLEVASEGLGCGTTFTVRLPGVSAPQTEPPSTPRSPLDGVRVLLVHDDEDMRALSVAALMGGGASVGAAGDEEDALLLLRALRPDVLVAHLDLDRTDSTSLVRRARAIVPRLPAVVVTRPAGPEELARSLDAGFDEHLFEPLVGSGWLRTIADVVLDAQPPMSDVRLYEPE